MTKVSIIIPAYNCASYIRETLLSALEQTWPDKEIIVVDDGSTDSSADIVRSFASRGVRLLQQKNGGAGAARNRALAQAQGDFIQYLDADDLLSPDKITEQIKVLEKSDPRKLAVSATRYFQDGTDPGTGFLQDGWPLVDSDDPLDWLIQLHGGNDARQGSMVQPGSWLVPRAVADDAGLWDEAPSPDDDGEYFARVVLKSSGIRRAAHGCVYYRKHAPAARNLCGKTNSIYQRGALRSLEMRVTEVLKRTSEPRAKLAFARCYKQRAWLAYPFDKQVSREALRRARELGDPGAPSEFGTWKGRLLAKLFGWRAVRLVNVSYHARKSRGR